MIKFRRLLLTGLLCFATLVNSIPARQSNNNDAIERASANIAGAILVNGHLMDYLRALTDQFGGRLTGTPAYRRSAEWAANQFREAGIKNVKLEPWTIPNGWDRGWAKGRIISPLERPLHIESLGWAP